MKAVILAAGEGTRLRPLTLDRPKPMLPVGGRPILEHLVAYLRRYHVTDIAINLHHKPDVVLEYFGDGRNFGVSITYSPEQQLLGSAGAVKALEWYLKDEPFFVLYGDVLTDVDLGVLMARHCATGALATLALHRVDDPWRCGIVQLDPDGWITRFVEKPPAWATYGNLANSGIYAVDPEVLREIPFGRPFDFGHDLFPALLARGAPLLGYASRHYVLDIGSPERYQRAEFDVRSGRFRSALLEPSSRC
jgi:NDP-sugar pyrophosphorylase family protein